MSKTLPIVYAIALALSLGAVLPSAASAQEAERRGGWGGLPSGNYLESCRDIDMRGNTLTAQCRTSNGYYRSTALNMRDCRGGFVENRNGSLQCAGGSSGGGNWGGNWGGNGGYGRLPDGNYRESCRDIDVRGDILTAQCRTSNGYYRGTSLSLRDCRGGYVENRNGSLQCRGGSSGGNWGGGNWGHNGGWNNNRLPSGNYRETCRDINVRGDALTAQCRNKYGSYNYTSLNLRGCYSGTVENRNGNLICRN